jgi:hypothetical protein
MCQQAFVIGVGWRNKTLNPLQANLTGNRTAIRTLNRTREDGPLDIAL